MSQLPYLTTISEARNRTYGNFEKDKYQEGRCVESVHSRFSWYQCQRKNGHGPGGLYCKQHDPVARKARRDEDNRKWEAERKRESERLKRERACIDACDGVPTERLERGILLRLLFIFDQIEDYLDGS